MPEIIHTKNRSSRTAQSYAQKQYIFWYTKITTGSFPLINPSQHKRHNVNDNKIVDEIVHEL